MKLPSARESKIMSQAHREAQFSYDERKFKELLLYVSSRLQGDPSFGATKLNKILFFADMSHYAEHGTPITGATYVKRPFGPVPKQLLPARQALIAEERATLVKRRHMGALQKRLVNLGEPELEAFSATELGMIDEVIEYFDGMSAGKASRMSHRLVGWQIMDEGETIPYHLIFIEPLPLTEDDVKTGRALAEKHDLLTTGTAA